MELQPNTQQFLQDVQKHAGKALNFPTEVGMLVEQADVRALDDVFRDVIFHAKFVTRTQEIMTRIGPNGEGFDKLSAEFQNSIEKTSSLLKTIVKESPEEIKQHFIGDFFGLDQKSFGNFIRLLEDLGRVKNYELDGRSLPLSDASLKRSPGERRMEGSVGPNALQSQSDTVRIRNAASLGVILMALMFLVDPPVLFLGWGLAIIVFLLLVYIAFASHLLFKKSRASN